MKLFWVSESNFLEKDFKQFKNEKFVNNINDRLFDLRKAVVRKKNSLKWKCKENSWYCWKRIDFNKQEKGERIKILPPKKMLQRLPIAFAQIKVKTY